MPLCEQQTGVMRRDDGTHDPVACVDSQSDTYQVLAPCLALGHSSDCLHLGDTDSLLDGANLGAQILVVKVVLGIAVAV